MTSAQARQLLERFHSEFNEQVTAAQRALALALTHGDVSLLLPVREVLHRLAGIAEPLGYRTLGALCSAGEEVAAVLISRKVPPVPELFRLLSDLFDEVAAALEEPPVPGPRGVLAATATDLTDRSVLIVDDDPLSARLLQLCLNGAGARTRHCQQSTLALTMIGEEVPDLILLDLLMPGQDGFATCRQIRNQATLDRIPIIFITRLSEVDDKVYGLQLGGDDYLTKPFDPDELLARVKAHILRYDAEREQAHRDPLTGAFNLRYYRRRLEQEVSRAQAVDRSLALVLLDVDHFKQVNDQHGHLTGDQVLHEIIQRIGRSLRRSDVLVRCGGDELAIILPETGAQDAGNLVERILRSVDKEPICSQEGTPIQVTLSAGIAQLRPDEDCNALVSRADALLYRSKREGRNRWAAAGPTGG